MNCKKISILGATGSIGLNTLQVIRDNPDKFTVETLTASSNWQQLAKIAIEFKAKQVLIADESYYEAIKHALKTTDIKVIAGNNYKIIAEDNADLVISAIVGVEGLKPTIEYIRQGKQIALANKESLICAGFFLKDLCRQYNTKLLPIDSEHNALLQLIHKENKSDIKDIIITASGGAFRDYTKAQLENVTKEMAINHPNWQMGAKITVDCASLVNKGLELIEAYFLFDLKPQQVSAIMHPESIVHGIVNFKDGTSLIHASKPSMQVAISYAMDFPNRSNTSIENIDLLALRNLNFRPINEELFPCFQVAREVLLSESQANMIIFNMANEVAVNAFLNNKIKFTQIYHVIVETLNINHNLMLSSLDDCFELIDQTKQIANNIINTIDIAA
ncbi:1-deoxy-D-xylulose-5-phosphate reductoisomerase [Rickettsiales endosymbiont of Stachyamoeba lipophora]|uniref:1-deoxy-D-xylulose-5-phosphate reductoisomerase n=1 Tax=Rickettsiales endosymbiont of Stachyamoeba lipophora TaxID=2486578 RepID=UPI000F645171|nr:1-deoxy-D-xylulose-5-phosphate reductoisomerase [Rickettsiales endosymbiont of Stachyamoeba lipophora]AZL15082.1 1-deoxy-D-xylulose-5-phosphate reductoisomerase [Rickettsiales endosymbiont of Stachyamoeba lipophora]